MNAALRREILGAYPDPAPLRRLYRRLRLARGGYDAVEALVPAAGLVVDLGCGEGLLAHVLVRRAPGRRVLAIDHDPRRVDRLRRSASGLPIEARDASFATTPIPPCDAVLAIDVLHYLDRASQETLVERAAAALNPGGVLVLRDPDAGLVLRMLATRLHERLFTTLRITKARIGAYRTSGAWARLLEHAGLAEVRVGRRPWLSPYADRIVAGRKAP
jgi:trans-aconitate methyltransferase